MGVTKERIDVLVQRQAEVSRAKASALIRAGAVFGPGGERLDKPGLRIADDTVLVIRETPRYVSRGGEKLEAALDGFGLNVRDRVAIDVGASTGGFTDCMLQRGAARVYAVDVGYGQLAWALRQDPRVVVLERTNIRHLTPERLAETPSFFAADCSFISLRLVLPPLTALLASPAEGVVLIKPQFEAGKEDVGKGGVVRDSAIHARVVDEVLCAAREMGFESGGVLPSPLLGPAGNREFLAHLRYPSCSKRSV
ncbi:MAG TPA: TlyA family RNA methyltransferase [Candidatus Hydrogenedentes bacterium]|nr:TlyA family RNA methyltransferase [Candidatus Hydrogenedentota bacterium]HPG66926.1 TlyA family RNA methyltransferase [Candidatus Hydrogenedentota bacterium]